MAHYVIRFADHLHITVLDAVVDHFHIVSRTVGSDPITAGTAVLNLCCDRLEYVFDMWPGFWITPRHNARSFQCALFASGDACAYVEEAFFRQFAGAAHGVLVVGVAAVDNDIPRIKQGK